MAIQDKYSTVFEMINNSGGRDVSASEEGGVFLILFLDLVKNGNWIK